MRNRRLFTALTLAGVCLMMASCIDSKEPISAPQKAKLDSALSGAWVKTDTDGQAEYCHIGRAGGKLPEGLLRMITATHGNDGDLSGPGEMLSFASKVGDSRFLNLVFANEKNRDALAQSGWDSKRVEGYILFKYEVKGDSLTIWAFDKDAKRRAIQSGKIKGTIEKTKDGNEIVYFTDTSENIAALLASPDGADLFVKEPIRYQRVK